MRETEKLSIDDQILVESGAGRRPKKKLVAITLAGFLLLNYPLAQVFSAPVFWFGIPLFYFYLFGIWLVIILLAAFILESPDLSGGAPDTNSESTKQV